MSYKPDPNKNVNLTVNGIPVTVPEGTRILEAAKKVNVSIPVLCDHPELCKRALCRICMVEYDSRGKPVTACGNDVWEGVNIVTNSERLFQIRKTILEMILAVHPQDCLTCVRNTNCELQKLAAEYDISSASFENEAKKNPKIIENDTIVRDMDKCVKCNRCVEVCQEIQTIRAINTSHRSHEYEICTAYKQTLSDTPCVFCGGCAAICPVGAICGHDQTDEIRSVFDDSSIKKIAQVTPALVSALQREFPAVTMGKIISAIRMLGFDKVYDAMAAINAIGSELGEEVQARKKSGKKLPIICGCTEGASRFIKHSYPELADNLSVGKSFKQQFASLTGEKQAVYISFVLCIAQKYKASSANAGDKMNFALSTKEFVRMIKLAGIMIETLPEGQFDSVNVPKGSAHPVRAFKKETVHGYAQARKVMETILAGKCDADVVEIMSCPAGKGCSTP
ncbi:MAG: 2Fe-2S iron-sulfur cluster-binding protein [Treponema sp.]|nr:2Fe-2S iron-sulfur cluster-binding protein [Treponema sp.]